MKRPIIWFCLLLAAGLSVEGCGESNCPLTTASVAHFDFLDEETHAAVKLSPSFDVTGYIVTDVVVQRTREDGTVEEVVVKDSLIDTTLYNQAESSMSLPLSFTGQTTYVLHYTDRMRDTITLTHKNIPYIEDIECGTMMFYHIEDVAYTTHNLNSIEIVNPDITNEEKKNLNIYYSVNVAE